MRFSNSRAKDGVPLKVEPIDLREIVTGGADAIQHQLSEAGGKIDIDLDVPRIQSDRFSLELIIGNLLDNAVKYRATDRPLHIKVRSRADCRRPCRNRGCRQRPRHRASAIRNASSICSSARGRRTSRATALASLMSLPPSATSAATSVWRANLAAAPTFA